MSKHGSPALSTVAFGALLACSGFAQTPGHPPNPITDLPEPVVQSNHAGKITAIAVAPAGDVVASGSVDGTVKLWSSRSGLLLRTIAVTSSWVRSIAFSPDGFRLAVGAGDHSITLYERLSGTQAGRFEGPKSAVIALAFLQRGAVLAATTTRDSKVYLWRTDDPHSVLPEAPDSALESAATRSFLPPGDPPVAVTAAGQVVARADGAALRWSDGVLTNPLRYPPITAAGLRAVRFSPDDHAMVTTSNTGDVAAWDLESGALSHYLPDAAGATAAFASAIAFNGDGTSITAVRGDTRNHWTWVLSSLSPLTLPPRTDRPNGFTTDYFPEWGADLGAGARPMSPQFGIGGAPEQYVTTRAALAKSGEMALYSGFTTPTFFPYVTAANLRTGAELWTYRASAAQKGRNITAVVAAADGSTVTAAFDDGTVIWLDGASGSLRAIDKAPTQRPMTILAYSQRGDLVAGASSLGELAIWRADGTQLAPPPPPGQASVLSLAFSADSAMLASGAADTTIQRWDIVGQKPLPPLVGHTSAVTALTFAHRSDMLVSGSEDSTLRLWNGRTGEWLATAIAVSGGDWLAISPQGFFDGTRGGWNAAPFRFDSDPTRLYRPEQFFQQFYQPGLLADVAARQESILALLRKRHDSRASLDVSKLKSSDPPIVQVQLDKPTAPDSGTAQLSVSVSDGGSGMRDLRIFRNQSLVRFVHGNLTPGREGKAFNTRVDVDLVAGPNELSAYAFNRDDVKSEEATAKVLGNSALRQVGTAYVIAVGVNKYSNTDFNLRYAAPDAKLLSERLGANFDHMHSYKSLQIPLYNDEATRENVLFALQRLAGQQPVRQPSTPQRLEQLQRARPEDAVVFYFAGHGEALHGQYYLVPYDLGYTGSKAAMTQNDLEAILSKGISDGDLNGQLEQIDAGRMMLVIDACYSGQVLDSSEPRRGPLNTRGIAQLAYEKGAYVLSASQSDTEAQEPRRLGHGVLTYVLEQGLGDDFKADENGDGVVTAREWFQYAQVTVPLELTSLSDERAAQDGRPISVGGKPLTVQRPQFYFRREVPDDWVLARRSP
jgi:WD40 repeat protein